MNRTKLTALAAALALAALPAGAGEEGAKKEGKPAAAKHGAKGGAKADPDALYGIGLEVARNLETFDLSPAELEQVLRGVRDAHAGKARTRLEDVQAKFSALAQERRAGRLGKLKEQGAAYAAKVAKEPGAVLTGSGLVYVPVKEGTGATPSATSKVRASYEGRLVDGTVFDASAKHGGPLEFPLNGVIACWSEGLQKMKVGGKAKLVCPSAIAYGEQGAGPLVPPGATLVFDVELVEVK